MHKIALVFFIGFFYNLSSFAGCIERELVAEQYIKEYKDDAIKEMFAYNIPASITLAQGMLESTFGTSDLAKYANNHFGIKCHKEWEGPVFIKDDDAKDECFRKYETVLESYTDHSLFLRSRPRYTQLFNFNATDYISWAYGLREAGYATDPKYSKRLLELIETFHLYKFDIKNECPSIPVVFDEEKTSSIECQNNTSNEKKSHPNESEQKREVFQFTGNKFIVVDKGDSFEKISKETGLTIPQLIKYNDITDNEKLYIGEILFLNSKNRKSNEDVYLSKKGDTMRAISQLYCVKLKLLYKRNQMKY